MSLPAGEGVRKWRRGRERSDEFPRLLIRDHMERTYRTMRAGDWY